MIVAAIVALCVGVLFELPVHYLIIAIVGAVVIAQVL